MMRTMRRALLALLVVFMLGTGLDLMLLDHHEGMPGSWSRWRSSPPASVVSAWTLGGRAGAITAMRILMVLFVAAGFLGITLHYLGNREFQLEMDPAARRLAAVREGRHRESTAGARARVDGHDGTARPASTRINIRRCVVLHTVTPQP